MKMISSSVHFQLPLTSQSTHKFTKPSVSVLHPFSLSETNLSYRSVGAFPSVPCIQNKSRNLFSFPATISSSGVQIHNLQEVEEVRISSTSNVTEVGGNLLAESGLRTNHMPKHVGVILDGNMRWAKEHNVPASAVHERLLPNLTELYHQCIQFEIPVLSAFIFSTQNWSRPQMEVEYLMNVYETYIKAQLESFMRQGIRVSFIGDSSRLPLSFQRVKTEVEQATKDNTRLHLIYAMGYSGQYDMMQACQSISDKVKDGVIQPNQIDESVIEEHLQTNCTEFPHPDLVIRTGGKLRVSNFFLWQLSYSELFFAKSLWPDFGETEFIEALRSFQERRRDFGKRVQ